MNNPVSAVLSEVYLEGSVLPVMMAVTLPDIEMATEEVRTLGVGGGVNLPRPGHGEPMEATFQGYSYVREFDLGLKYHQRTTVEVRTALNAYDPESGRMEALSRVVTMGVMRTNRTGDELAQDRNEGPEYTVQVLYYREELDGVTLHEIDPLNKKWVHAGTDLLAPYRAIVNG